MVVCRGCPRPIRAGNVGIIGRVRRFSQPRLLRELSRCLREYIYSEPFEQFDTVADQYIACLFLRHERGELTWATFLRLAGEFADSDGYDGCSWECERFYGMLNRLEDAEYASTVEGLQKPVVLKQFGTEIAIVRPEYEQLCACRRSRLPSVPS